MRPTSSGSNVNQCTARNTGLLNKQIQRYLLERWSDFHFLKLGVINSQVNRLKADSDHVN